MNFIEVLESRIAPAGIVDVIVSGGNLVIKTAADHDDVEQIAITPGATDGTFKIDPDAATQIRFNGVLGLAGAELEVTGVTKGISISLGKDSDSVTMTGVKLPGAVKVDLGEGSNNFTLDTSLITSLSYKGGSGDDQVVLKDSGIAGKVEVVLGNGSNTVPFVNLEVAGDFTVKGGSGMDVLGNVAGTDTRIGGKFTLQLGDGGNILAVQGGLFVAKDALITSGKGNDNFNIASAAALTVGGNLTFNTGKGQDLASIAAAQGIHVGKNLSFISGGRVAPADTVGQGVIADGGLTVGGNVTFTAGANETTGQAISSTAGNVSILGKVSFKTQANMVQQMIFVTQLQVGGGVTIDAKENGAAGGITQGITTAVAAGVQLSQIRGGVTINGGQIVTLAVMGDIFGAAKINTSKNAPVLLTAGGAGADFVGRIHGSLTVKLDPTVTGSAVTITGYTIGGALTFTGSKGADTVTLQDLLVTGATKVETGDGADTVNLDALSARPFISQYSGAVSVNTGAGTDTINVASAANEQRAVFLGKSVFKTGSVGETLSVSNNASFLIPAVLLN